MKLSEEQWTASRPPHLRNLPPITFHPHFTEEGERSGKYAISDALFRLCALLRLTMERGNFYESCVFARLHKSEKDVHGNALQKFPASLFAV
jgi:hypothetical protein